MLWNPLCLLFHFHKFCQFYLPKIDKNQTKTKQKQNPAPSYHAISIAFTFVQTIMISCLDGFKSLLASLLASIYTCLSTDYSPHSRVILLKHIRPCHFSAKNHPLDLIPFREKAKVLTLAFKALHNPALSFSDLIFYPSPSRPLSPRHTCLLAIL